MIKFRKDISNKNTSIGYHLNKHRDELFALKDVDSIAEAVKKIFTENKLTSPKANQILFKLEHGHMAFNNALLYLQNIMFASAGLATY